MKYVVMIGFVVMIGAQWYVPLSMIFSAQATIDSGVEYHFRTQPIDPSDPFRGKYITLNYNATTFHTEDTIQLNIPQGTRVFATIATDTAGFGMITRLGIEPPAGDVDYVKADFDYSYDSTAYLSFPFNTFYVEESKASEAEQLYWQGRVDSSSVCYAKVMVRKGDAKLVDVIVRDSSILDIVARINRNKKDN